MKEKKLTVTITPEHTGDAEAPWEYRWHVADPEAFGGFASGVAASQEQAEADARKAAEDFPGVRIFEIEV